MNPTKSSSKVEGEGSYEATHRYNAGLEKSIAKGRASELGKAASKALDGPEGDALRAAEAAAKAGHVVPGTVDPEDIRPGLPVVCSENGQFAVVDHLEGKDTIKVKKDKSGQHHYMPLSWVTFVDDKVHVDRPGDQAMRDWSATPPARS
ncbi:MAG TPA: DUF2171 domain-containing protein [Polyangiaceae bacterium]